MKKTKSVLCVMLLSTALVGTTLANTGTTGGGMFGFFDNLLTSVASFFSRSDEICRPRQCTNCKPNERDENGDCRPPAN